MNNKLIPHTLSTLRIIAISSLTIFTLYTVQAWVSPIISPPNGNVGGPLTTATSTQIKTGSLGLLDSLSIGKDLIVNGTTTTNILKIISGAGANKVLTSDASGNASWQVGGGVTNLVAGTNITLSPVSGVGAVTVSATGGTGISAILKPWLAGKSISCPFGMGGTVYAKVDANGNPYTRVYYNGNDSGWVYGFSASISAYSASWSFGSRPSLSGTLSGTPFSCQGVDWPLN